MKKLLVICGPTGTGKTSLALRLASKFKGDIVSADSRQVYRNMDIGTGKDLPKNARWQAQSAKLGKQSGYYKIDDVRLWGYDVVNPGHEFSVSLYLKIVSKAIKLIWDEGKLPILTGGTGLYIKGVVDGISSSWVPKNPKLRIVLDEKTADELFENLAQTDPIKAASLNKSDKRNLRRLVRAIEIAQWEIDHKGGQDTPSIGHYADVLFIGLTATREELLRNVKERIDKRITQGLEKEIKSLLKKKISWNSQSMQTLGYREWKGYFSGRKLKTEVVNEWKKNEKNYIKRQLTWFKKDKRIKWFDIKSEGFPANIEKAVEEWYISS